jgi:acyl-CoA thioester hydrolase
VIAPLGARIRLGHTNATGCVDAIALLELFEAARADGLRAVGLPYEEIVARGLNALTIHAKLANHGCAHVEDLLLVRTRPSDVGRLRFRFSYDVRRSSDYGLIATGETTHICIDGATGQPARLPDWLRDGLMELASDTQARN